MRALFFYGPETICITNQSNINLAPCQSCQRHIPSEQNQSGNAWPKSCGRIQRRAAMDPGGANIVWRSYPGIQCAHVDVVVVPRMWITSNRLIRTG
jgi:hypothetical protein